MEPESDRAVDTLIVGLQKIHEEAEQLGLHEVAHLASTVLLAAEEEAERRIILHRGAYPGEAVRDAGNWQAPKGQISTDQPQAGQLVDQEIRVVHQEIRESI